MSRKLLALPLMLIAAGFLASCSGQKKDVGGEAAKTEDSPATETVTQTGTQAATPSGSGMGSMEGAVVLTGNQICPISGHEVKQDGVFVVEFQGKKINLCCGDCKPDFDKDPEAAAKKAGVI